MNLKELIVKFNDKEIVKRLFELYPKEKKNLEGYLKAIDELRTKRTKKTDMSIEIAHVKKSKWNDEAYDSVNGVKEGDDTPYAIEYTKWSEWLSMPIVESTIKKFSELDILCHCLWEMTWSGYSQRKIQRHFNSIMKSCQEAMEDIAEGKNVYEDKQSN